MSEKLAPVRFIKYFAIFYIVGSVIYSTGHFLGFNRSSTIAHPSIAPRVAEDENAVSFSDRSRRRVTWSNKSDLGKPSISEDLMLDKAFGDAMGPSQVKPYYFKAQEVFDKEEVTISTLVTHNRFKVLSRLATRYKGPISVAIHVNDDESKEAILADLHQLFDNNPDMGRYVDIHLVIDNFDRQFNMWRNVAKFFARTDYIMMLDVDFHLCTDFRKSLRANPALMDILRKGHGAVVIPAFEFINEKDGEDWREFPKDKNTLKSLVTDNRIDMFHRSWTRGHGSTNYTRWYGTEEPYKVTDYNYSYEPYVIYKKNGSPWCEERFIGYGANKAACLYEIYLAGIDYWVLPEDFLIHQTHHYPEETRAKERKYNKKLYDYFREEVCLRYSRTMISSGVWDTPLADNVKQECAKIGGFDKITASMEI